MLTPHPAVARLPRTSGAMNPGDPQRRSISAASRMQAARPKCDLDRYARERRKHQEKKSLENFCLQSTPFCPVLPAPICPALPGSTPF